MKCNVGGMDRMVRLIVGIALLIVGFTVPMAVAWQTVVFVIAAIALVTGLIRFCPVNALFKLNTCQDKSEEQKRARAHG